MATLQLLLDNSPELVDARHFAVALKSCARARSWREACQVLSLIREPNVIHFNSTIAACEWPQALQVFEEMPRLKVQRDVVSFNATMSSCGRSLQWQRALKIFKELSRRLQPSLVSSLDTRNGQLFMHVTRLLRHFEAPTA